MILGFTGKMGSGKTTVCEYIRQKDGLPVMNINFKDALIAELKQNFTPLLLEIIKVHNEIGTKYEGMTIDELFTFKPTLVRKLMQGYGTEVRRGDNPNYWVNQWRSKVAVARGSNWNVLTDDVRFLNEAQAVKVMGGFIVRIIREDIMDVGSHQSESEMDQIAPDFTIVAKKDDHANLYKQIDEIIAAVDKSLASKA